MTEEQQKTVEDWVDSLPSNEVARFTILGIPRVKKNNQKLVTKRNFKTGGLYAKKINTKAYAIWHSEALAQILKQKPAMEIDYPVNLKCLFYMANAGRVDLSALYEGIQDTLVECQVLTDDNYKIVASHDGSGVFVDRANPRMEITITKRTDLEVITVVKSKTGLAMTNGKTGGWKENEDGSFTGVDSKF